MDFDLLTEIYAYLPNLLDVENMALSSKIAYLTLPRSYIDPIRVCNYELPKFNETQILFFETSKLIKKASRKHNYLVLYNDYVRDNIFYKCLCNKKYNHLDFETHLEECETLKKNQYLDFELEQYGETTIDLNE